MNNIQSFQAIDLKLINRSKPIKTNKYIIFKYLSTHRAVILLLFIFMFLFLLIKYIQYWLLSPMTTDKELLNFLFYPLQTNIIESLEELQLLRDWITPERKVGLRLVYKATVHGDSSIIFHRITDKDSNYIILMKTNKARFGGYTSRCFRSDNLMIYSGMITGSDMHSFLFSLTHKKKYPINPELHYEALTCEEDYGPIFGNGDISIPNKFLHSMSSSQFPKSFLVDNKADESLSLTANEKEFQLIELEAYHILFGD